MTESDQNEARLKTMRDAPSGALRTLFVHQIWLWRWSGLVVGLLLAILIAFMTLTPLPAPNLLTGGIDKVYHFVAFATLIFPVIVTDSRRWVWAVPLAIAYGGAIELIQPYVGRGAEWLDFGADITGVLAGAALAELLHDRIRDKFFAVDTPLEAGDEAASEALRLEAMRTELMDELREVLREELKGLNREQPSASAASEPRPEEERGLPRH